MPDSQGATLGPVNDIFKIDHQSIPLSGDLVSKLTVSFEEQVDAAGLRLDLDLFQSLSGHPIRKRIGFQSHERGSGRHRWHWSVYRWRTCFRYRHRRLPRTKLRRIHLGD